MQIARLVNISFNCWQHVAESRKADCVRKSNVPSKTKRSGSCPSSRTSLRYSPIQFASYTKHFVNPESSIVSCFCLCFRFLALSLYCEASTIKQPLDRHSRLRQPFWYLRHLICIHIHKKYCPQYCAQCGCRFIVAGGLTV